MQMQNIFKLHLEHEIFEIPSQFANLNDINPYIYQILLEKGEYAVRSKVNKKVFQAFLDHWIYNKTPYLNPLNISEYDQLSYEFDRMKDLIEIFTSITTSISSATLKNRNNKLKKLINSRTKYLKEFKESDQKIIEILFHRNEIKILSKFIKDIKYDLSLACYCHDVEEVDLLTRRKVTQNDITYFLNEEDKTAVLYASNQDSVDIFIPRSIMDDLTQEEYVIISLFKNSFAKPKLKSITFSEDSEVQYFNSKTFFNSNIETITIPSSLIELKDGWCFHTSKLTNIFISKNCHFSYFDNKYIIGKSNPKSDIYDVLHFARRDIEEALIPAFIKFISPYAFNFCRKLRKIQFAENSELISIGCNSFSETIIQSITIPSHVTSIGKEAFYFCNYLKKIEFLNDSELKSIENSAFSKTGIEYLSIPSSVVDFNERWCNEISKLKMISIIPNKDVFITLYNNNLVLEKSDKKSDIFDNLLFAYRNIQNVIIPPFIKRIKSMAFNECYRLNSLKFSNHSELVSIEKFAFYSSSLKTISIPKYVEIIDDSAFSNCMKFNRINFHENSKLKVIGKSAFSFTSIKSISIPLNVTKIGEYAFTNCRSLKIIEIPENLKLKTIKKEVFNNSPHVIIMVPAKMKSLFVSNLNTKK